MDIINSLMKSDIMYIVIILILGISVLWNIITSIQISKLTKKYKRFMRGTSGKNIETVINEKYEEIDTAINKIQAMNENIVHLNERMDNCIQKCNIIRYNAFSDTGSDLSFSITLLDNFNNGVVLTGIYGRNESITYAKPIVNGESKYPLSVEEQMSINKCIKKQCE